MVIQNRTEQGESPSRSTEAPIMDAEKLQDVLHRLYAADTILRFAATQPVVDISMRRRLNCLAGKLMVELSLLNAELAGLGLVEVDA